MELTKKFVVASMKSIDSRLLEDQTKLECFECKLPNHFARDCHVRRNNNQKSRIWKHFKNAPQKRYEGGEVCASSIPNQSVMALPTIRVDINGNFQDVLIDSECTCCIIYKKCKTKITKKEFSVVTVNGQQQQCEGVSQTRIVAPNANTVCVEALVVDFKPLGFCF